MNDNTISDKRRLLFDMQEHPEQYTDEQINRLLDDEDVRTFFHDMAMSKRAMRSHEAEDIDVDEEWEQFLILNSKFKIQNDEAGHGARFSIRKIAAIGIVTIALAGIAVAAVVKFAPFHASEPQPSAKPATAKPVMMKDSISTTETTPKDTLSLTPETFEDQPLSTILNRMAAFYHVKVVYRNDASRHVRLYFRWDKHQTLEQNISILNGFDRINITFSDNTLTVD